MLRFILLLFLVTGISKAAYSQKTIYLNKDYEKTGAIGAKYKGVITHLDEGFMMKVYRVTNNDLVSEGYYSKGKKPLKQNRVGKLTYYHDNGKISSTGEISGEHYTGDWTWYYSNGNKSITCHYDQGNLNGEYHKYFRGNIVHQECTYKNDTLVGEYRYYFPNGKLAQQRWYVAGKVHDTLRTYHLNGKLSQVVVYDHGKKNGSALYYHANGQLAADEWYEKGILTSFKFYNESGEDMTSQVDTAVLDSLPDATPVDYSALPKNIVYPPIALENDVTARIKVTVYIDEMGEVFYIGVIGYEVGYGLEEEAIRGVKASLADFKPFLLHNRTAPIQFTIPITFDLK